MPNQSNTIHAAKTPPKIHYKNSTKNGAGHAVGEVNGSANTLVDTLVCGFHAA